MAQEFHHLDISGGLVNGFFLNDVDTVFTSDAGVRNHLRVDDGAGLSLRVGWRFSPRLSVEGRYVLIPTRISAVGGSLVGGAETDVTLAGGGITYRLSNSRRISPYLRIGGGVVSYASDFSTDRDPTVSAGGGVRIDVGDRLDLRLELLDCMSSFNATEPSHFQNDLLFTTGLVISLL